MAMRKYWDSFMINWVELLGIGIKLVRRRDWMNMSS